MTIRMFLCYVLLNPAFSVHAQEFIQKAKIVASDRRAEATFGWSTAIYENNAIIGAQFFGSAYIIERKKDGNWIEIQKLTKWDSDTGGEFGWSVSIFGKYAIVGAPITDGISDGGERIEDAGAAYIFEQDDAGNWNGKQKIIAADRAPKDYFGWAVGITSDYAIVGAYTEDEDALGANTMSLSGSAYIFERDESGNWIQKQKLVASNRSSIDYFGYSVNISAQDVIVGAPGAKSAYIFERDSFGTWIEIQRISVSDQKINDFGDAVGISKNYAIVTDALYDGWNGAAFIFEKQSSGQWEKVQKLEASDRPDATLFGSDVSLSEDYAVVGATWAGDSAQGSAYVFKREGSGAWMQTQKIIASDRTAEDRFGYDVSIWENNIVVGAPTDRVNATGKDSFYRAGSAYIFEIPRAEELEIKQKCIASDLDYIIPNIITPNGDPYNETFFIANLNEKTRLKIFNRYGQLVYYNDDYQNNWSGNDLTPGIYYYQIRQELETCYNEWKGWLQIAR